MKILILSQYFAPEPVEKVIDEAVGLHNRGHDVQVLTSYPCYPQGKIYAGFRQRLIGRESFEGADVIRVPQLPDHSRSVIRRALYYFSFAFSAMSLGPWFIRRADVMVVYQSALPTGLAAWWISRVRGIPYVLDVVDLWPESVVASGMLRNRFLIGLIRIMAWFVYSRADRVSVITEGYRDRLIEMGIPADRICVVNHWKQAANYGATKADLHPADEDGLSQHFNVMYTGNVGPCQSLGTMIECAERLRDHEDQIQFVIVGDGMDLGRLQELVSAKRLKNVRFLERRPTHQIPALLAAADSLVVHLERSAMADVSIPSKTISYLAAGRPILMGVAGECTRFVEQNECGIAFEPQNADSMAKAVLSMFHATAAQRERWAAASLRAYDQHFDPQRQLDKLTVELSGVALKTAA